jgi:ABC-type multidrug transport system ATPase subunit
MVRLENISKSFENIKAVDNISFKIPESKITIIAGADGSGKSTIFKMIIGLIKQDSGKIYLREKDIGKNYRKITSIAGYMPERFSLYKDLTVEENMNFFADINQVPGEKKEKLKSRLLTKTGMSNFKNRRAGNLSGGMKQKLALSTILLSIPEFIILDEPTTGVDPLSRIEFFNIIKELKEDGKTIIISTPYLDEAEKGDYIVFVRNGRIIKKDSINILKNNFPVKLFKILPKGNIFEIINKLKKYKDLKDNFYIQGKYIKYIQTEESNYKHLIPHYSIEEEKPKLEDIYIYYERMEEQRIREA